MAHNIHRSGRMPIISPEEVYRQAQQRGAENARKRNGANRGSSQSASSQNRSGGHSPDRRRDPSPSRTATPRPAQRNVSIQDKAVAQRPHPAPVRPAEPKKNDAPARSTDTKKYPVSHPSSAPATSAKPTPAAAPKKRPESAVEPLSQPSKRQVPVAPDNPAKAVTEEIPVVRASREKAPVLTRRDNSSQQAASTKQETPSKDKKRGKHSSKKDQDKSPIWRKKRSKVDVSVDVDERQLDTIASSDDVAEIERDAKLSQDDVKKIHDTYADYRVSQQVRSNSKKVEKLPRIYVTIPRKKKIHKVITSWWTLLLVIAIAAVSIYGYTVKKDAELSRAKDAAYAQGVESTSSKPDISGFMKMDSATLTTTLTAAQGVNYPKNTELSRFNLVGWNTPGGTQKESKVEVDFCYSGDGQKPSQGSAFLFTPDIMSTSPQWTVDTVSLTQVPCGN